MTPKKNEPYAVDVAREWFGARDTVGTTMGRPNSFLVARVEKALTQEVRVPEREGVAEKIN